MRDATVELAHALFGRTVFGRVVGRLIGEAVYSKAGGRRRRVATKEKAIESGRAPLPKTRPVQLDNGVEYYPPERKKP